MKNKFLLRTRSVNAQALLLCVMLMVSFPNYTKAQNSETGEAPFSKVFLPAPAFSTFGLGVGAFSISFPNIHLKAGLKYFSNPPGLLGNDPSKGLYLGLYVSSIGVKSIAGLRLLYLWKPIISRINYYPLLQIGKDFIVQEDGVRAAVDLKIGAGVIYSFNWRYGVFAEIGSGLTPLIAGVVWRGNFYSIP